jgi:glucose/arabinose dehydrogenase
MRIWRRHNRIRLSCAAVILVAACSPNPAPTQGTTTSSARPAPTAEVAAGLVSVTVQVPDDLSAEPFDEPRQVLIPSGWTLSVWARVPKARLAAWTPDGSLLVSVPSTGQLVRLQPTGAEPFESVLLDGLDQPHGMAFAGSTLYIAESDRIDAYDYADGQAANRRTVAAGLPDAKSPDLRGAYAHALKSVAVGSDGAIYFSIGSFLGRTAVWAISRHSSGAFRPTTAHAGAARSPRWRDRTARSTSPMTTPAPCTGWRRPAASGGRSCPAGR